MYLLSQIWFWITSGSTLIDGDDSQLSFEITSLVFGSDTFNSHDTNSSNGIEIIVGDIWSST